MNDHASDCLNLLEQQPALQFYTQIYCISPLPIASSRSAIITPLEKGLERLSAGFPWIAGQVVNEGCDHGNSGVFRIAPLAKTPILVVRDLQDDISIPTLPDMRNAHYPMTMLDESVFCPRKTVPSPEEAALGSPVFMLQATFIKEGLVIAFLGQHQAMDGTGQGHLMHLFSKACRDEPFSDSNVRAGNLPRRNIIPLLRTDETAHEDFKFQIMKPSSSAKGIAMSADVYCTWAYYAFLPDSLKALKGLALRDVPSGYVSTNDAITAFIWQSVSRARLHRLDVSTESVIARSVNVRHQLGIAPGYLGLLQNTTYNVSTLGSLNSEPIGVVASQLRSRLDPELLAHQTRSLASYLHHSRNKNSVKFTASVDRSSGIMLNSWVQQDCYELDFGLGLGKPEVVRRPRFDPMERLVYLMPEARHGEIAAALCLRDTDMERLREDEEFARFAKYRVMASLN